MLLSGVGLALSTILLIWLVASNPFFVDSFPLALLLFVVVPALVFAVIGLLVGVIAALITRRHAGRSATGARRLIVWALLVGIVVTSGGRGIAAWNAGSGSGDLELVLIGVDGATWKVVNPMLKNGMLPNLSSIIEDGSSGVLMSVSPMFSPRIFTSIASGKVADKHGVQGASDTTTDAVLVKRIWDILYEQKGWDYGLLEWYVTGPPEASPGGFCIPGPPAVDTHTFPAELCFVREIEQNAGGARGGPVGMAKLALRAASRGATVSRLVELVEVATYKMRGATKLEVYRREHQAIVGLATDAALWQMRRGDVQVLAGVYRSTDRLSHAYWRYYEPDAFSGTDPEELERFGTTIEDIYATVDEQLGRLRRRLAPDGTMMVVSDHGFRPHLKIHAQPFSFRTETLLSALGIDYSDLAYVNLGYGFYLQALTTDEEANAARRAELEKLFAGVTIEESGEDAFLVTNVDEVGTGDDYVEIHGSKALLASVGNDPLLVSENGKSIRVTAFLTPSEVSGAHDFDGLIAACGPAFPAGGEFRDADIFDVTPTALAALGLPLANDMDGRPLVGCMRPDFLESHPVTAVQTYESGERRKKEHGSMDEMSEDLKEQLRSIGYIE